MDAPPPYNNYAYNPNEGANPQNYRANNPAGNEMQNQPYYNNPNNQPYYSNNPVYQPRNPGSYANN
jgi:hypothetical protein